jgi:hypothetical protein
VAQVAENLPSKYKTLSSNSTTTKRVERERERERERAMIPILISDTIDFNVTRSKEGHYIMTKYSIH